MVFGANIPGVTNRSVSLVLDGGVLASWVGVNAVNVLDLLTQVNCQIVVPGTTQQGTTDAINVEAGLVANNNLILTAYDINGNILGTNLFNFPPNPLGPDGRPTASVAAAGIAFFSIALTAAGIIAVDTFAVNEIDLNDVTPVATPTGALNVPTITFFSFPMKIDCCCPGEDVACVPRSGDGQYYAVSKGALKLL